MKFGIRIGIAGAGVFGNYHANKCALNPQVNFVGIYDTAHDSAGKAAQKHGVTAYAQYADMLRDVDAVIISSPAVYHGEMAAAALRAGCHCLIEKPLAASLESGAQILELSNSENLIVQTGHQERFVAAAIGLPLIKETPKHIRSYRMGQYSPRGIDVSVTLDLMIHDLDLVLWLTRSFPENLQAQTKTLRSNFSDETHTTLEFTNSTAELTASRIADDFKRTMEIQYPSGTVHIDFNAKTIAHDTPFDLDIDFAANPIAQDSLKAGLVSFVEAIKKGAPPAISAQDGYDALRLALMIDAAGAASRHI